jgi:hypothetical protein
MMLIEGNKKKTRKQELIDMYYKALDEGEGKIETAGALVGSCFVHGGSPVDMARDYINTCEDLRQLMIVQKIYEEALEEEERERTKQLCENELKREAFKVIEGGLQENKEDNDVELDDKV